MSFSEASDSPIFTWDLSESVLNGSSQGSFSIRDEEKEGAATVTPECSRPSTFAYPPRVIRTRPASNMAKTRSARAKEIQMTLREELEANFNDKDLNCEIERVMLEEEARKRLANLPSGENTCESLGGNGNDFPWHDDNFDRALSTAVINDDQSASRDNLVTAGDNLEPLEFSSNASEAAQAEPVFNATDVGARLAIGLKHGTVRKGISEDVQKSWDESNENSKNYERTKIGDFNRMIEIIKENGGPELSTLASQALLLSKSGEDTQSIGSDDGNAVDFDLHSFRQSSGLDARS